MTANELSSPPNAPAAIGEPKAFVRGDGASAIAYMGPHSYVAELRNVNGFWSAMTPG